MLCDNSRRAMAVSTIEKLFLVNVVICMTLANNGLLQAEELACDYLRRYIVLMVLEKECGVNKTLKLYAGFLSELT
jgi:hypothetical protein